MNWESEARRIVKAELVRRGMTYSRLAALLCTIGVEETERSVANKMSRGSFSFVFPAMHEGDRRGRTDDRACICPSRTTRPTRKDEAGFVIARHVHRVLRRAYGH